MADQEEATKRLARLTKLFNMVTHGQRDMKSGADGSRFLESLCAQQDVSKCIEVVVASSHGLDAIASAFRFTGEGAFLNGPATSTLRYLSDPSLKTLYAGQFLRRVLEKIVDPPTFWNTLVEAHQAGTLSSEGTHAFAWLLLELISTHTDGQPDVRDTAAAVTKNESLITAPSLDVRNLGQQIKHVLESTSSDAVGGPGGRHDNDFVDFRRINVLPTPDEFATMVKPFYRRADAIHSAPPEQQGLVHLDNQFRLLREDFMGELRNDFQIATGQKKGQRRFVLAGLQFEGVDCGTETRRKPCALKLRSKDDIPRMSQLKDLASRKKFIRENKNFIKHQSFGCLISEGIVLAFAHVDRNEDLLALSPPVIVLQIADAPSFSKVLIACKATTDLQFVQVDTAVFAFEPILKCLQSMRELPLEHQLLSIGSDPHQALSGIEPVQIVQDIRENWESDLQGVLSTPKDVHLDKAQAQSLIQGLTKRVSLIQGPPGTGKSFIGALIAKVLFDHTKEIILVQTYTNHSLDQILEDFLSIGIPASSMVRLGQKYNDITKALTIPEQSHTYRMSSQTYKMIQEEKTVSESYHDALIKKVSQFRHFNPTYKLLLEYLEFSEDSEFYDAFLIPKGDDGMSKVNKRGKAANEFYLLERWAAGNHAGIFREIAERDFSTIWRMPREARTSLMNKWSREMTEEHVSEMENLFKKYNNCQDQIQRLYNEKTAHIIGQKRIIGCTTTAAAKYTEAIRKASPGVILVEEAGEILESHVLTAMTSNTKQLVLISDHKQLRPKVNNYSLTIENGSGYNLNQSLFERLVVAGVPHATLNMQHRMRPEISALVRTLTYPELGDASTTQSRPNVRGFQDNLIFVSHDRPELNAERIADRRDEGAKASKENQYEAEMVLKCVRYLGQQGYGTDNLVILTPYLGQLYLLLRTLSADSDPVLNDLDSFEFVRAGLLAPAASDITRRKIRISTIDNYQGEESDIVIVSLTRSNTAGDIGFMAAPQRVNVLLSRAKNALIMIGNARTFMESRKGREVWTPLMEMLKKDGHVYDGFPVQCEQHPDKQALLCTIEEFDTVCPDGGCSEPCGKILNCGLHSCPHRCHQLQDHSKMQCNAVVHEKCPQNHPISRKCHDKAAALCKTCDAEARAKEKRRQREHQLDLKRQAKQEAYALKLAAIEDEIEQQKNLLKDQSEEQARNNALAQKRQDLANLKKNVQKPLSNELHDSSRRASNFPTQSNGTVAPSEPIDPAKSSAPNTPTVPNALKDNTPVTTPQDFGNQEQSEAKDDWDWQKQFEMADNKALDLLIGMIGLESVKQKFLAIKAKIDTVVRQNASLANERYGAALLGNPGTGKTTVARLYADFLVNVGALPGNYFLETSGAALANEGVTGCKAHIQKILNIGGGVFFIDEAYQLVSGNSPGGMAVLDYLLPEIENLTGRVTFVMAGYRKQMEAFFAHNPGIPSRIPIEMEFHDYTDKELLRIMIQNIEKKYDGRMKVEDGLTGLYMRIVARRLGRGRGRDGFGNAREVQNRLSQITERQAKRLRKQRKSGLRPDDHQLTKEDLIGPEPSSVLKNSAEWARLRKLIGLKAVKESVQVFLDGIQYNYQRELEERPIVQYSLNRCFIGSSGTGKTSVAKLYGRILADIGLLSNGEVLIKNPADFIGNVIGQSEKNTKGILASAMGKVLIIDEAYMLAGNKQQGADVFKTAIIDTIVAEVQSTPGEDRCVLLLGYKDQMEDMFCDTNPGLARRFPLDSAFVFEDFSDGELRQILDLKLKDVGYDATDQAKQVAIEMLQRARNRPNFGNAGEVDILLDKAKAQHQKHLSSGISKHRDTFEALDFDPDFDRSQRAATNVPALFRDTIGCEDVVKQLQRYQNTAANMKSIGMDPREQIPFNFLFKGPPGTGKTTTAQKMGKVFYDMGFLASAQVEECSATDMIGKYIGHTGPKVQKLLEKALGKVLFIDEAYRLAEPHGFATEAMDELVDCLTKPKYKQKMIVILAGYDEDMNRLMSMNPGLTSRFPDSIFFKPLNAEACLKLLTMLLINRREKKKAPLDLSVLEPPSADFKSRILDQFHKLSKLKSWGNARDVNTIAKSIFGELMASTAAQGANLVVTEKLINDVMDEMFSERSRRGEAAGTSRFASGRRKPPMPPLQQGNAPDVPKSDTATTSDQPPPKEGTKQQEPPPQTPQPTEKQPPFSSSQSAPTTPRDAGVSDATWNQLELDKQVAVALALEQQHQAILDSNKQTIASLTLLALEEDVATKEDEERRAAENAINTDLQELISKEEEERLNNLKSLAEQAQNKEDLARLEREQAEKQAANKALERKKLEQLRALHDQQTLAAEDKRRREQDRIEQERLRREREAQVADMQKEREKERKAQSKLREMGVCVMGYRWIKQSGGYRCAGGSHYVSDAALGV